MQRREQVIKSVEKLTAQSTKLCDNVTDLQVIYSKVYHWLLANVNKQTYLYAIVDLLFHYGLRINEVLSINVYNITKDGHILIKGSKKSQNRIIIPIFSNKFFKQCKLSCFNPFESINRFHVYRELKKLNFYYTFGSSENASVTHLFRSLLAVSLSESGIELEDIKNYYGHQNINNTRIYATKNETKKKDN